MNDQKMRLIVGITKKFGITEQQTKDFINADWDNHEEHEVWLTCATVAEIADWVICGFVGEEVQE